jgi:hypothetical protein
LVGSGIEGQGANQRAGKTFTLERNETALFASNRISSVIRGVGLTPSSDVTWFTEVRLFARIHQGGFMGALEILSAIDYEIAQLQKARAVLIGSATAKKAAGAPKKAAAVAPVKAKPAKKKRKLTPEGRRRIAEAVKKRWAAQKAAAGK